MRFLFFYAALVFLNMSDAAFGGEKEFIYYVVKKGDTFNEIIRRYAVSNKTSFSRTLRVHQHLNQQNISNLDLIYPGDKIILANSGELKEVVKEKGAIKRYKARTSPPNREEIEAVSQPQEVSLSRQGHLAYIEANQEEVRSESGALNGSSAVVNGSKDSLSGGEGRGDELRRQEHPSSSTLNGAQSATALGAARELSTEKTERSKSLNTGESERTRSGDTGLKQRDSASREMDDDRLQDSEGPENQADGMRRQEHPSSSTLNGAQSATALGAARELSTEKTERSKSLNTGESERTRSGDTGLKQRDPASREMEDDRLQDSEGPGSQADGMRRQEHPSSSTLNGAQPATALGAARESSGEKTERSKSLNTAEGERTRSGGSDLKQSETASREIEDDQPMSRKREAKVLSRKRSPAAIKDMSRGTSVEESSDSSSRIGVLLKASQGFSFLRISADDQTNGSKATLQSPLTMTTQISAVKHLRDDFGLSLNYELTRMNFNDVSNLNFNDRNKLTHNLQLAARKQFSNQNVYWTAFYGYGQIILPRSPAQGSLNIETEFTHQFGFGYNQLLLTHRKFLIDVGARAGAILPRQGNAVEVKLSGWTSVKPSLIYFLNRRTKLTLGVPISAAFVNADIVKQFQAQWGLNLGASLAF